MVLIAAVLAVCLFVVLRAVRSSRAAKKRKAGQAKLEELLPEASRLYHEIASLSDYDSGYLMKKDWDALLESAAPTLSSLAEIPTDIVSSHDDAESIAYVTERCQDTTFRERRNGEYKEHELRLCDALFSNVDGGKSLDQQQRDAIVTDEYSNLVIAGAGSGKTSVVVGKVKYLVERWHVDPSHILVTSFTRASVDDLKRRIEGSGVKGVAAKTFHALGLNVLGDVAVAQENALQRHVTSYLSKSLASHPDQAAAFLEFFGMWSLTPDESPDSKEAEERIRLLKAQDMRTLKGMVQEAGHQSGMDTMLGERVKSVEELMIANFLFLNGVAYEYERPYDGIIPPELADDNHRAYQPDFYLTDYDIWLEHFGIDEHGRVPWMKTPIEEQRYIDGMEWKRKVHAACGTRLIESYSWWNKDHDLLNKVEALLKANGIKLVIDPERNAAMCGDLLRDERFFGSMTQLISTFISLVKASNATAQEVDDKARERYRGNGAMWHRYDLFTRFAWPIMESYQQSLASGAKPRVDFDDMINRAAERIRAEGYSASYRYIIVDEYQDISLSRFGLLSAIRDATGAKLMCVGDDWQAIYRFAGSDVTLFTNFGKLVGHYEEMRIEHTYRNSQALVDVASTFVLKNPDQMRKNVTSMAPVQPQPPVAAISLADQRAAFTFALNDLLASPGAAGEIKVLGRNRRDLERIFPGFAPVDGFSFRDPRKRSDAESKFDKVITYAPDGGKPIEIGYMTIHKSKGLQADNVIVIGLVNDRYGFPNMIADDPILELLLADSDRYDFAEERRLFYVALTRTKNRVWLVTGDELGYPGISAFADELRRDNEDSSAFVFYSNETCDPSARCPRCGGVLLRRTGPSGNFVGCSGYPYCDKTYRDVRVLDDKKKCPVCGGWLTRRVSGRDGREFFGCTNWPTYCQYTVDLDGTGGGRGRVPRRIDLRVGVEYQRSQAARTEDAGMRRELKPPKRDVDTPSVNIEYEHLQHSTVETSRRGNQPRCPKCGANMVLRSGPYGQFYGCTRYPSCKGKLDYRQSTRKGSQPKTRRSRGGSTPRCPRCGAEMILRTSRYGKFYGCSRFPSCKGKRDCSS
ncbi:MAG: topoisomerase DNA-binding C4 zinc finger domain-containing protein [Coriobacteriales bacterium]|nr:topoisomerase DNA-binding C4 zinc finger domain-containing protein [Coriobacteriales bacterium]